MHIFVMPPRRAKVVSIDEASSSAPTSFVASVALASPVVVAGPRCQPSTVCHCAPAGLTDAFASHAAAVVTASASVPGKASRPPVATTAIIRRRPFGGGYPHRAPYYPRRSSYGYRSAFRSYGRYRRN